MPRGLLARSLSLTFLVVGTAAPGAAQDPSSARVTIAGGVTEFDIAGSGTAPVFAVRADLGIARWLVIEPSLSYAPVDQDFGDSRLFLPEIQAQLQWPLGPIAPYLGVGAGYLIEVPEDDDVERDNESTFSGAAGLRVDVTERVGARGELRLRATSIDDFSGTLADWTAGLSYRL